MSVSTKDVGQDISRIRKAQLGDLLSPSKKLKIVERYRMTGQDFRTRFASSSLDSLSTNRRIQSLEHDVNELQESLASTNKHIMVCKTSMSNKELENCKLEDDMVKLDQELEHSLNDVEKLQEYEADSLLSLQKMYERRIKEQNVCHDERLMKLKEDTSDTIKAAIVKAKQDALQKKLLLQTEVSSLNISIRGHSTDTTRKLIKLKEDHHKKLLELKANMDQIITELSQEKEIIEKETSNKEADFEHLRSISIVNLQLEVDSLNLKLTTLRNQYAQNETEINQLKENLHTMRQKVEELRSSCGSKLKVIEEYRTSASVLKSHFPLLEEQRRVLHNRVQEIKGNIRVFCRIRPVADGFDSLSSFQLSAEGNLNEHGKEVLTVSNSETPLNNTQFYLSSKKLNAYQFQFDKLFGMEKSNLDIFPEISQLIQSSLDGYNVCVFAYGQTGSGKTWTMAHKDDGMIPLSFKKIFEDINDLKAQGWVYDVEGQFVEIYNEQIGDLLAASHGNMKCEIKHDDESKHTTVTNVTTAKMHSEEEALRFLINATNNRSTASTMANERSSRSHLVFMLKIKGVHHELGKVSAGTLNLIDLAGSERLKSSQAKGSRLKETQSINKSLSCLGDVISGLAQNNAQHIPYRNSKLTYLLKHSLGGDSKTLMFVNISPLKANLSESINSLRFATKVNSTKLQ